MNKLYGKISKITSHEGISLVNIKTEYVTLGTVLIDTPQSCSYLKIGKKITVAFKETEVAIALPNLGTISMANQINCKISKIENGKVLAKISLTCKDGNITSIITTNSSQRLQLKERLEVIALIKANEISLIDEEN
ncbi:MAG TPA: tobe domain protein [Sulfurospirillum arcachonense]|nr:tobe domain protein [Sulfurospirillum arcachonense]HIP45761.1 tobe domain protein [Sulfurospirillum arcachonense]